VPDSGSAITRPEVDEKVLATLHMWHSVRYNGWRANVSKQDVHFHFPELGTAGGARAGACGDEIVGEPIFRPSGGSLLANPHGLAPWALFLGAPRWNRNQPWSMRFPVRAMPGRDSIQAQFLSELGTAGMGPGGACGDEL